MSDITDERTQGAPLQRTPTKFTTLRTTAEVRDRLRTLKKELGFSTYTALFNYTVLEITREGAVPPASYDQIFEKLGSRPCIITGRSGAGKSTCVKSLLSQFAGNVFLLDVAGEYTEFKDVDLGKFFSIGWGKEDQKVRFIPNPNVEISKAEASTVFSHLNFIKNSGALKNWCLVIEEGHRFGTDPNLRALLIEARKFVRKLILVTTDWRQFGDIAQAFKPAPWEPRNAVLTGEEQ
ncbi:MAG: DUF87 domain-containing protein [Nitrososphaerota archaeon]|nr:DUF87 domain-containing protein [Nitrososphaerota archaeon]MDG6979376.1 DUF87 domain-containing protein [Nitrososphaerota archaeon]